MLFFALFHWLATIAVLLFTRKIQGVVLFYQMNISKIESVSMIKEKERLEEIQELDRKGDITGATVNLIKYLDDHPDSIIGTFMLAGLYYTQEMYDEAEPLYEKIPKHFPKYPTAAISLFHILWQKDSRDEAMKLLDESLNEADSNDPEWKLVIEDFTAIKEELIEEGIWLKEDIHISIS